MKKGVLFSLGLTFIALVILGLATLIYNNSNNSIDNFNSLSLFERLNLEYISTEKSIARIFNVDSNINISFNNFNITIQEAVPNNYTNFKNNLISFSNYVRDNFADFKVTLLDTSNNIKIMISPNLINYTQNPASKKIIIKYKTINFLGLNFNFNTGNSTVGTIQWEEFDSGSFPVSISVANSTGSLIQDSKNIDMNDEWEVRVNGLPGGEGRIELDFDNGNKEITIENSANILVNSKTTVLLNRSDFISVIYPEITLSVNSTDGSISKTGNPRIFYNYQ